MSKKIIRFIKRQAMPSIAILCALASMIACPPRQQYIGYINADVLIMLFCLMASISGLKRCGIFTRFATRLISKRHTLRRLSFILVMLPLFTAMFVTNDVALLTFTPLAILALTLAGDTSEIPQIVVLQAIAANLGGMITPVGNPQNLFIFTYYQISLIEFAAALAPFALAAIAMLIYECFQFQRIPVDTEMKPQNSPLPLSKVILYLALFTLCIFSVIGLIPKTALLAITILPIFLFDRKTFRNIDYGLLITFACFFIFSGNLASTSGIQELIDAVVSKHAFLTSLFASQVISNVPAAILLAPFSSNWHALLLGVDIGGLGTPIASLASLIALKFCLAVPGISAKKLLLRFSLLNAAFLVSMIAIYSLLFLI